MASEPGPADVALSSPPGKGGGGLFNLARGAKGIALLLFLIPWVTVSCGGTEIASMSGYELGTGSISVRNPLTGQTATPPDGRSGDIWVIAAAGLILGGLILSFVLPRVIAALLAALSALGAAAMLAYTVLVRLPAELRASPLRPPGEGGAGGGGLADLGMNAQQMADLIKVDIAAGFWLLLALLVAAAVLNVIALVRARAGP